MEDELRGTPFSPFFTPIEESEAADLKSVLNILILICPLLGGGFGFGFGSVVGLDLVVSIS